MIIPYRYQSYISPQLYSKYDTTDLKHKNSIRRDIIEEVVVTCPTSNTHPSLQCLLYINNPLHV